MNGREAAAIQAAYYARTADAYDAAQVCDGDAHGRALDWLAALITERGYRRVLDVGAGTGRAVIALRSIPGVEVIGVEPVAALRAVGYANGLSEAELVAGDGLALAYGDGAFDVVCAFGVLHHVRDHRRMVAEMCRVARCGVFISDSNNLGQGGFAARMMRRGLRAAGLWRAFDWVRTGGRGYHVSAGDGVYYSYTLLDDGPVIARTFSALAWRRMGPGGGDDVMSAPQLAVFASRAGADPKAHYDAAYFDWQKRSGALGGWSAAGLFGSGVSAGDRVLDFGCGGGYLLAHLACAARYGVEPNAAAREAAAARGVTVFANVGDALAALGPGSIDVVVSDNALEHALEPYRELVALRALLRDGGRMHLVVPCEGIGWRYDAGDINRHLYSWSPQSIGNLVSAAGFEVEVSRAHVHKFPPRIARGLALLGRPVFDAVCRVWGRIDRRWFQVEVRAVRLDDSKP